MKSIRLNFEKGGSLTAILNNRAPKTVKCFIDCLPITTSVVHTRWCGREFSFGINTKYKPPKENYTNIVSKFDITYWRDWNSEEPVKEAPAGEAISVFYGAELIRYHAGELVVNVIGRIDVNQEEFLEEIGERIWLCGKEKVVIELIKD